MGVSGMAASTIGFVFLGCISLGYFGGAWLDKRLGTTIWTPTLTVVGMLAGFVETFRTLKQIARTTKWPSATDAPEGSTVEFDRTQLKETETAEVENKRLFQVPPPPLPEYENRKVVVKEPSAEEVAARLRGEDTDKDTENK